MQLVFFRHLDIIYMHLTPYTVLYFMRQNYCQKIAISMFSVVHFPQDKKTNWKLDGNSDGRSNSYSNKGQPKSGQRFGGKPQKKNKREFLSIHTFFFTFSFLDSDHLSVLVKISISGYKLRILQQIILMKLHKTPMRF